MTVPSQLLSYYPTYSILDEVLTSGNYKNINFYFDIKNNLQSLYMQHSIIEIVENTLISKHTDSSVFESILQFLSFHRIYCASRNINPNFYIFMETGRSSYHLNISKQYKIKRRIDDLYGLDREKRELFFNVLQKNFMLLEKAANKMPNTKVIRMQHLEADFIPYYLITRNLVDRSNETAHIIYSNDHDLLQCLHDDVYLYVKIPKAKKLIKKNQALKSYLKFENQYQDSYLPLVMSIIGDVGDDVYGIKGIGGKTVEKIIDELIYLTGGIDNLYNNVMKGNQIFNSDTSQNKYINSIILKEKTEKLISNNLKLVSFELISRYLENPASTEVLEKKKYLENILNDNQIIELEVMRNALEKTRVYLSEGILDNIYYNS